MLPTDVNTSTLLLGGAVSLSIIWWLSNRRPSRLPPGPGPALPVLGHLHLLEKDPRYKFRVWRRRYGDVFSLYLGSKLVVVLNGFQTLREALVKMGDAFSDRPHLLTLAKINQGLGLANTNGPLWKEQRKTALEILREFGMGKNLLAERIQEEITHYIRAVHDRQGAPAELHDLTASSVSNNICAIAFGRRFEYDDPMFMGYLERVRENLSNLGGTSALNLIPTLEYLPGDLFKIKKTMQNVAHVLGHFIQPQIKVNKETFSQGHVDSFIHAYLRESQKKEEKGETTSLDEANLEHTIAELFIAGTDTTATTITWTLLHFLHHPSVQEKCYQEICDVIGTSRAPSLGDRLRLTYVEATILEVLRISAIAPLGVPRATSCDVTFRGYVIPAGTMIIPCLDSVFADEEIWGDPEKFRPERFIGPDGKLTKPEEMVPFSLGRRACLGEGLARTELFLYLTSLIQRFRFLPADPEALPSLEGTLGVTYSPKPYKIRAVPRE